MLTNIYDSHTHSLNSHDGVNSVDEMCKYALENGIKGFALTDHCELDLFSDPVIQKGVKNSFLDMERAKEAYGDRLLLSSGVELGQMILDEDLRQSILKASNYDFVLGSMHCIVGKSDFCMYDYSKWELSDIYKLLEKYYEEMSRTVRLGGFDSFAHITYPLRYIEGEFGIKIDITKYEDYIDDVLKTLAQNGKALEINTSGLRQKIGKTMPTMDYAKRFKSYGGELITLGSDAHRTTDMSKGISETMESLKEIGFTHYAFFKERKPNMIEIK